MKTNVYKYSVTNNLKKNIKKGALFSLLTAAISATAQAAPQIQTCAPMEITYNGDKGMAYSLNCVAGPWGASYTGAVPAGVSEVTAYYRLDVTHPSGLNFSEYRHMPLNHPSHLGMGLQREAVLLENGELALRECPTAGCTLYRPIRQTPGTIRNTTPLNNQPIAKEEKNPKSNVEPLKEKQKVQPSNEKQLNEQLRASKAQVQNLMTELEKEKEKNKILTQSKKAKTCEPLPIGQVDLSKQPIKTKLPDNVVIHLTPQIERHIDTIEGIEREVEREYNKKLTRANANWEIKYNMKVTELTKEIEKLKEELQKEKAGKTPMSN